MNVLYIVGGEGNRYGSEIIAIDLLTAGEKNGIHYTVITANKGAVSEECERLGINHYVIPFTFFVYKEMKNGFLNLLKKTIWRARAEFLTWRATHIIEKKVDMETIDVIHTNLTRDLLGGILAKKHHIPHIWHIHELFKAHYQLSFLRRKQLEWMKGHADSFIAISDTVAREWIEQGIPEEMVHVVYNGIDMDHIKHRDHEPGPGLRLVMVGHLVPAKGQDAVIRKLGSLPVDLKRKVSLDCAGEGTKEYKAYLLKLARELGVRLNLLGYCSDIGNLLKNYDIGVNCSKGEGFGLSTVEYMAAGLCPLVADTGANEEIIKHGSVGFVFSYDDDQNFKDLMVYLDSHREEIIRVSEQAREKAGSFYTIEKMRQDVYSLYKEYKADSTEENMKQIDVKELREIQIGILDYFDAFCRRHGIRYWLDYGTLIGAVRHQGYIPWDDDLDIGMLREDYQKASRLFNLESNGLYDFSTPESNRKHRYPFGKITRTDTVLYEYGRLGITSGVYIDVFPYDNCPKSEKTKKKMFARRALLGRLRRLQLPMRKGLHGPKRFGYIIGSFLMKAVPVNSLERALDKNARRYEHYDSGYICEFVDPYDEKSLTIPKKVFQDLTEVEFENKHYMAPVAYDYWLKSYYGDYMQLPPENERVSHHVFEAYYIND